MRTIPFIKRSEASSPALPAGSGRGRPAPGGWRLWYGLAAALLGLLLLPAITLVGRAAQSSVGSAASGAMTWYFAEGFTGPGFDEYLTIQNPNDTVGTATITYYVEGQTTPIIRTVPLAANSRTTVIVHESQGPGNLGGLGRLNVGHSTKVEATLPVVVERPMYFLYQGAIPGGHDAVGATALAGVWNFAEGFTGPGFDEYLTIQNPNDTEGTATITYYVEGQGTPITRTVPLPPNSRTTVIVHEEESASNPGGLGRLAVGHSTRVEATLPVVVERPMYFTYGAGITGGHIAVGAAAAPAVCMAALRGEEEVPPVASPGVGAVRLAIDPATGVIRGEWVVNGLTSDIEAAHIHAGPIGVSGPVVVPFTGLPEAGGAFTTIDTAEVEVIQNILANPDDYYVNVHTANHLGGEVRGQLSCTL